MSLEEKKEKLQTMKVAQNMYIGSAISRGNKNDLKTYYELNKMIKRIERDIEVEENKLKDKKLMNLKYSHIS